MILGEVQPSSPAESAGFRPGDQLIRVGDLAITSQLDIERALLDAVPGQPTRVLVRRDGREQELPIDVRPVGRLAASPVANAEAMNQVWRTLGLKTTPVDSGYVAVADPRLHGGLYVEAVNPDSPGGRAAIQKGDILVGIDVGPRHWETVRPDGVLFILQQAESSRSQSLPFYFVRSNRIYPGAMSMADIARAGATLTR